MKIGHWYKSTLAATAVVAMVAVGCSSSDGGDTTTSDTSGPVFTSPKDVNIDENTVYVTTLTAKDASLPITFEITGGYDMSKFQLGADNRLKFIVAPDAEIPGDFDGDNQYVVKVKATDALGNSREPVMTVTVIDTGAPGFISDPYVTVDENTLNVTTVSVQAEGGAVTLSITGGEDLTLFDLNSTSGQLKFKTAPNYEAPGDFDTNNIYKIVLTAAETTGSTQQQMEVTVNDVSTGGALQIVSAVYDVNGTAADTTDDSLFVYFDRQIDGDGSGVIEPAFALTGGAAIVAAKYEFTPDLPYKLTVTGGLSGFEPNITNINVAPGGFEIEGEAVLAGDAVTVTAIEVILSPSQRDFALNETDGIIVDNDLNVTWRNQVNGEQTWSEANTTCETLDFNGSIDWRLPSIQELLSTANRDAFEPAIYDEFNQTNALYYWSSTSYFENDTKAWVANFTDGSAMKYPKDFNMSVRCIRGEPQSETIYIRDATVKIVYDTKTGLIWDDSEATQADANLTWNDAIVYCTGNSLGGYTWRAPSFSELESLVEYGAFDPSISDVFVNINSLGYWTSTEDANTSTNNAWSIRFSGGESELQDKGLPARPQSVRCVTDGQ
ncbi:MAG: DUF1566 domain-containing protein [Sulfurimonadaceae bacterium]